MTIAEEQLAQLREIMKAFNTLNHNIVVLHAEVHALRRQKYRIIGGPSDRSELHPVPAPKETSTDGKL
jgi:hypothetical protein